MKNIIVRCCLALVLGIFLLCDVSEEVLYIALAVCAAIVLVRLAIDKGKVNFGYICMAVFFMVGGFSANRTSDITRKGVYLFVDRYVVVTGRVEEVNTGQDAYDTYVLRAQTISLRGEETVVSDNIDVRIYKTVNDTPYQYGDIICIDEELTRHRGPQNSGEMDYARWRQVKGVFFEMSARYTDTKYIAHATDWWNIFDIGNAVNTYAGNVIDTHLEKDTAALMHGILLSDKSAMSGDVRDELGASGLAHISVVSGMHVSILLTVMFWLMLALKLRRRYVYIIASVFLVIYAVVLGCSAPIVRAVIMALLFMLSELLGRDGDRPVALSIAAAVILLFNPMTLYDIGFQMSFLSILGISLFCAPIQKRLAKRIKIKWVRDAVACTIAVYICITPILINVFGYIPVYAILSNILVAPILPLMLIAGILLVLFSTCMEFICPAISLVLSVAVGYVLTVARFIARLPYARPAIRSLGNIGTTIYAGCAYLLHCVLYEKFREANMYKRMQMAIIGGVCLGMLCFSVCTYFIESDIMDVTFINVGQGDAAVITMPDSRVMLIDGGGSAAYSDYNVGEKVLVPYLLKRGIELVDIAVVTHYDKDHAQGVAAVLEHMDVGLLVLPLRGECEAGEYRIALEQAAKRKNIPVSYMSAGGIINFGDVRAAVLSPAAEMLSDSEFDENDLSLVLRLSYGGMDFLFTGDIGQQTERALLARVTPIDAEVIKVAHHGSEYSSDSVFIAAVSPIWAIISVGEGNVYYHPAEETLETLHGSGTAVYRTDINGDITFRVRKDGIYDIIMLKE